MRPRAKTLIIAEKMRNTNGEKTVGRIRKRSVFVLDLDGVLYLNNTLVDGADKAVAKLRGMGYRIAFLTNNSGKHKSEVCEKLNGIGVPCGGHEVYTSVDSAVYYIKKNGLAENGVFYVGSGGMRRQLEDAGLAIAPPDRCGCILVGFKRDMRYEDAEQAIVALRRDVPFIICNRDPYFPDVDDRLMPGCGYTVSAIEGSYTRKADINAGKPDPRILDVIYDAYGVTKDDLVIVGDSCYSDIGMAVRAGIPAVYVGKGGCEAEDTVSADSLYDFVENYLMVGSK